MVSREDIDPRFDDPGHHQGRYPPDWDARRKATYRRDDYTCQNCGRRSGPHAPGDGVRLHAHHVVPRSRGGQNRLSNLTTLCESCHNQAHEHDITATMNAGNAAGAGSARRDRAGRSTSGNRAGGSASSTSADSYELHVTLGIFWVLLVAATALLVGLVVFPVGSLAELGGHVQMAAFLVGVFLVGVWTFARIDVTPTGDFLYPPFLVPTLLLALPLLILRAGVTDLGTFVGTMAVFGSVSLVSHALWYVNERTDDLHRLAGPFLFAVAAFGILGNASGAVRATLSIPWTDLVSLAFLGTPVGTMCAAAAVSALFVLPAALLYRIG